MTTGIFSSMTEGIRTVLILGSVGTALTQCFLGYRLLRFWVSLAGFAVGMIGGIRLFSGTVLPADGPWFLPVLAALAAGILLAVLANKLLKVGIFLFCGAMAWYALGTILQAGMASGLRRYLFFALQGAAFVLAGYLAVKFMRTAIIAISGIAGAWTAAQGLSTLLPQYLSDAGKVTGVFVLLAAAGIILQFLTTKK